jgi:hypothetical protein
VTERNLAQKFNDEVSNGHYDGLLKLDEKEKLDILDEIRIYGPSPKTFRLDSNTT